jgi:hypothetical protein
MVSFSLVRELGPVLSALMVAGRIGSSISAELGSMVVSQQIDAMRALGTDPNKKLVAPRIIALILMLPLLTIAADIFGIIGGGFIANQLFSLDYTLFITLQRLKHDGRHGRRRTGDDQSRSAGFDYLHHRRFFPDARLAESSGNRVLVLKFLWGQPKKTKKNSPKTLLRTRI